MADKAQVNFGFLLIPLQLLDMAGPMDLLSNSTQEFMHAYASGFVERPAAKQAGITVDHLVSSALDIKFHHIGPTMDPVQLTGGFLAAPTCTIENCPKLDYLLVGGPDPAYVTEPGKMPEAMKDFIRERTKEAKTVFSTCTGAVVLAAAGVLDGQLATVNHAFVGPAAQIFPKVKWLDDKNWVVSEDGKFWTAGGACAGMDMIAQWVAQNASKHVLDVCTFALEYQPRDVDGKMLSFINGRGELVEVA